MKKFLNKVTELNVDEYFITRYMVDELYNEEWNIPLKNPLRKDTFANFLMHIYITFF